MGAEGEAWAVARRSAPRKEAKEEQLVQQSVVVASSGARTTSGAGSQKHEEKSCPLVRAGCWCACDLLGGGTVSLSASSSSDSSLASMSSAAAVSFDSCCDSLLGACVCLLLLRLVPRLRGVLPTEAQYSRFQLCDLCRDSRVGLALSYRLSVHVHHPHLFEFR